MTNYEVHYDIQVITGNSVQVLREFEQAVAPLATAAQTMDKITKSLRSFNNATKNLKSPIKIQISIDQSVERRLDNLLNKIRQIKRESRGMVMGGSVGAGPARQTRGGGYVYGGASGRSTYIPPARRMVAGGGTGSLGYKVLGPTPIDVNGVAAIDFLKGMGIAYGIAGAGQLLSNIVKSATEYDNLIQSTKNILQTHDNKGNFKQRFAEMESVIRDVGVETKYTAPEVADAAKFLAMAGLDIDAIKTSIRPIADIALVGDTDLGETADKVTNIMTAYRMRPEQMRNAADVMTMTFTKSNTTLMEMAEAYKYSAALLSAGGISFEEASGALGVLGDAGIKGSQAGTTLRTIMANIVNPTKKQLKHWESLGIQRTNEDGTIRPLRDIFGDLANAGLYVDDFYKLFHKTAAQGAVSLANSVEKWNEIVADNFLSQGLSKRLADEKKNTLQGLWAQLTSAFTEDGMKGFGGIQEVIKDALRKGIAWLKSNEALEIFQTVAKQMVEFGGMMVDSFRQIFKIFQTFGPLIKRYFQFQLWIYPLLTVIRAIKSLILLGKGIWALRGGMTGMILGMGFGPSLMAQGMSVASGGAMMAGAGAMAAGGNVINGTMMAGGWAPYNSRAARYFSTGGFNTASMFMTGGMLPYTKANRIQAGIAARQNMPGRLDKLQRQNLWDKTAKQWRKENWADARANMTPEQFKQWQKGRMDSYDYQNIQARYRQELDRQNGDLQRQRRQAGRRGAARWGAQRLGAGALGAAAGIGTGAMIAESSDWSSGGILAGGLTAAASVAMMGGPVGWIGGAAIAVGTLAAAWYESAAETRRAGEALDNYISSLQVHNGLFVGEGASAEIRQLDAVYNKNLDLNTLIATRIELMRELAGLTGGSVDTTGINMSTAAAEKTFEKLSAYDSMWGSGDMAGKAVELANKQLPGSMWTNGDSYVWYDPSGHSHTLVNPDGTDDDQDVAAYFATGISLAVQGSESQEIARRFSDLKKKALWAHLGLTDVQSISKEFEGQYGLAAIDQRVDPLSTAEAWAYSGDQVKSWDGTDWATKAPYLYTLNKIWSPYFGTGASFNTAADTYFQQLSDGTITDSTIINYISEMDNGLGMWLKNYTKDSIDGWYRSMGINPTTGEFSAVTVTLPDGTTKTYQANEAAEAVGVFADQMLKLIPTFTPTERTLLATLYERLMALKDLAMGGSYTGGDRNLNVGEYREGDTRMLNGRKWTRRSDGKWVDNGVGMMSDAMMTQSLNAQNALGTGNGTGGNGGGHGGHGGGGGSRTPHGSNNNYQNHYKGTTAAPKQIIIKIENLMNVDSIDLTKKDNREAVNNVREELTQCLIDVVHDFAISSGNMV